MLDREALNNLKAFCEFCKKTRKDECGKCPVENSKYALNNLIEEEKNNGRD